MSDDNFNVLLCSHLSNFSQSIAEERFLQRLLSAGS